MSVDLACRLAGHTLDTPLLAAAGCAGFGHELHRWDGLDGLGALVTPSMTHEPREPTEVMKLIESPSGIVHPHEMPNIGTSALNATRLPWEVCAPTPVIVSIAGATSGEFADAAAAVRRRTALRGVLGIEMNLSVPNDGNSGRPFARDEYAATKAVARVREHLPRHVLLLAKLSLVSDVVEVARGVLKSGADAVVVGHPPTALAVDPETLASRTLGPATMSGPALLPMMLGAVYELRAAMRAGRLPTASIVAGGGVSHGADVRAALAAGADAVQVGSALFRDPRAASALRDDLDAFCTAHATTPAALVGAAHR